MTICFELLSPYQFLIGLRWYNAGEIRNGKEVKFKELQFGLLFFYISFIKYKKEGC